MGKGKSTPLRGHTLPDKVVDAIQANLVQAGTEIFAASEPTTAEILRDLKKAHQNLGHCSNADLLRALKASGASDKVLKMARDLRCDECLSHQRPKVVNPATMPREWLPFERIGIDVKELRGLKAGETRKFLNIVDRASGLQQMIPIENAQGATLREAYRSNWRRHYGPPVVAVSDGARALTMGVMAEIFDNDETQPRAGAGEAHENNSHTETHGGWYERIFNKAFDTVVPTTEAEYRELVESVCDAKARILRKSGYSPYTICFGRDPPLPGALLRENPSPVVNSAVVNNDTMRRLMDIRHAARIATIELENDMALRRALEARPRVNQKFEVGDLVAFWRKQVGAYRAGGPRSGFRGQWFGVATVLGEERSNYWISYRGVVLKAAPTQLRKATNTEMLGETKLPANLKAAARKLEGSRRGFLDLTEEEEDPADGVPGANSPRLGGQKRDAPEPTGASSSSSSSSAAPATARQRASSPALSSTQAPRVAARQGLGQKRTRGQVDQPNRRLRQKTPFGARLPKTVVGVTSILWTAVSSVAALVPSGGWFPQRAEVSPEIHDYLQAWLNDERVAESNVPKYLSQLGAQPEMGVKTDAGDTPCWICSGKAFTPQDPAELEEIGDQEIDLDTYVDGSENWGSSEILLATKKTGKGEVFEKNMSELDRKRFTQAKETEWKTLVEEKKAVKVLDRKTSQQIRADPSASKRIVPSRFVLTEKIEEQGRRAKARFCLGGHCDPDLTELAEAGELASPTCSTMGRYMCLQLIASFKWVLELGDIKGAFLEAQALDRPNGAIYCRQPPGGIPGIDDPELLILVILPVYGLNDSPARWFLEFLKEALAAGWTQSRLDPCVFFCLSPSGKLEGCMCVHVDDTLAGGAGEKYAKALSHMRKRFPYRKWRRGSGQFCGSDLMQHEDWSISVCQESFAKSMKAVKCRSGDDKVPATESEISALRGLLGCGAWLAGQSRPDLAILVARGQQAMPTPTLGDIREANQLARRARQLPDVALKFRSIALQELSLVLHTDSSLNTKNPEKGSQAGWILGFCSNTLFEGEVSPWSPWSWRSFRHKEPMGSTFRAESRAMSNGLGRLEWGQAMLAEALNYATFDLRNRQGVGRMIAGAVVTDCKSVWDHVRAPGQRSLEDQRASLDILIIKDTVNRCGIQVRWAPTNRQLADTLTKDSAAPADLVRACLREGTYQISAENNVLEKAAAERERRLKRGSERAVTAAHPYFGEPDKNTEEVVGLNKQKDECSASDSAGNHV